MCFFCNCVRRDSMQNSDQLCVITGGSTSWPTTPAWMLTPEPGRSFRGRIRDDCGHPDRIGFARFPSRLVFGNRPHVLSPSPARRGVSAQGSQVKHPRQPKEHSRNANQSMETSGDSRSPVDWDLRYAFLGSGGRRNRQFPRCKKRDGKKLLFLVSCVGASLPATGHLPELRSNEREDRVDDRIRPSPRRAGRPSPNRRRRSTW